MSITLRLLRGVALACGPLRVFGYGEKVCWRVVVIIYSFRLVSGAILTNLLVISHFSDGAQSSEAMGRRWHCEACWLLDYSLWMTGITGAKLHIGAW